jgi:hypothetical protein
MKQSKHLCTYSGWNYSTFCIRDIFVLLYLVLSLRICGIIFPLCHTSSRHGLQQQVKPYFILFINSHIGGVESKLGPLGTSATNSPIVPVPGDCENEEFCGMKIGRENRSIRKQPAPAPLCPPQIPHDQSWVRTRSAAVGSQRLTA